MFLAFQSQALHTDDVTGHALPGSRRFEDVVRDGGEIPDETSSTTASSGSSARW